MEKIRERIIVNDEAQYSIDRVVFQAVVGGKFSGLEAKANAGAKNVKPVKIIFFIFVFSVLNFFLLSHINTKNTMFQVFLNVDCQFLRLSEPRNSRLWLIPS